ncbi:nucleotidyl transferase family protein [Gaetbulibacter aestuarii]|uniref:VWA domain-containing protein n=1 Tax=Gaetbulibacter aestuarii TaxID=1502358 RepID=A0ABW7N3H7_9FLAO
MNSETLVYIVLVGIIALGLAFFQYYKRNQSMSKWNMLFSFLRFCTLFVLGLLLVNPKIERKVLTTEKPDLIVAVDNSNSIKQLEHNQEVTALVEKLQQNPELKNRFNIHFYSFSKSLKSLDTLTFNEKQTNISSVFKNLKQIYKDHVSPTILISDGNQTLGSDYSFSSREYGQPIYPVILGDTTSYTDLRIAQLNVNRFAYLKNRFPVEVILVYEGVEPVSSNFEILLKDKIVFSKRLNFSKSKSSQVVQFDLPADQVGVQSYVARLNPLKNEKNTINNTKNFAIEVIDQKTNVAIVSSIIHPDLGALKTSIETNERRAARILKPNEIVGKLNDFQLVILYQPNRSFNKIIQALQDANKHVFTIVGTDTDLNFFNSYQKIIKQENTYQIEDYQPVLNPGFSPFTVEDLDFSNYPPLRAPYGKVTFTGPFQTLISKATHGVVLNEPLLATFEMNSRRQAVLFGENIWGWRSQAFVNSGNFEFFDNFLGKLVQYLASNKTRDRLQVDYQSFYDGESNFLIQAQFFDNNYEFDPREQLNITIKNSNTGTETVFPLVLKNNTFQVDLSSMPSGSYDFTVKAKTENIFKSGHFEILDYNVEQQFLNADVTKLEGLATNSKGKAYFIADYDGLIHELMTDTRYQIIQKSNKNTVPLIDWKLLLIILVSCLTAEWFLRKYNGLI